MPANIEHGLRRVEAERQGVPASAGEALKEPDALGWSEVLAA